MKKPWLTIKQLDRQLSAWQQAKAGFRPRAGWIRILRKALGMTTAQLAKRLGVDRSRVIKVEQAEQEGAITLHTLQEVAAALQCEFVYALVPKTSLEETLTQRARQIAQRRIAAVAHSMLLEDQVLAAQSQQEQLEELVKELLAGSLKHLWETHD